MKIHKWTSGALLCAAALVFGAGCTPGSDPSSAPTSATATTPPATVTPPVTATAPPTTPPAPSPTPLILTTVQAAAEHLYEAWKVNDAATAKLAASTSAVTTLFAKAWKADTYFFGGCTEPTAPSQCQYNWAGGAVMLMIAGNPASGFRVTAVSFGSAG